MVTIPEKDPRDEPLIVELAPATPTDKITITVDVKPKVVDPPPIVGTEEHFKIATDQLVTSKLEEKPKVNPLEQVIMDAEAKAVVDLGDESGAAVDQNTLKIPNLAHPEKKTTPKRENQPNDTPVDQKKPEPPEVVHLKQVDLPINDIPKDSVHREVVKQAMQEQQRAQGPQAAPHAHGQPQKVHHQHERPKPGCATCSGKGFYHVATTIQGKKVMQATPCKCVLPKAKPSPLPRPSSGPRRRR